MRTRSVLLALVLAALLVPASLFGQTLTLGAEDTVLTPAPLFDGLVEFSLTSNASLGVFRNELGAAASVDETGFGPGFSELESNYFFGGLGNLPLITAASAGTSLPFFVGYYNAGDMPWSVFVRSDLTDPASALSTTTNTTTGAPETVDGVTYNWIDNEEVIEYDNVLVDAADNRAQFLLSIGGMNTGLYVRADVDNAPYLATDNYTLTDTFYYNAAAAGEVPDPQLDYRVDEEASDMGGRSSEWQFAAPLFLRTGDMSHYARVGASFDVTDSSTTFAREFTVPEDSGTIAGYGFAAGEFTNESSSETDTEAITQVGAKYTLSLPGLLAPGENNEFAVSTNLSGTFYGRDRAASAYDEDFTFTVGGDAQSVAGSKVETTTSYTYESVMDFGADLMASHSLHYDLTGAVFGLEPRFGVGFERAHNATDRIYLTEQVASADVDDDFAGSTTVTNTVVTPPRRTDSFDVSFGVPASVDIEPGTLPFGVILGAAPWVAWVREAETTTVPTFTTQTVVRDANNEIVSDTTTRQPEQGLTQTVDHTWEVGAAHNIGLYLNVGERVRIDMALNAANLLDFESFTLQTIIALP